MGTDKHGLSILENYENRRDDQIGSTKGTSKQEKNGGISALNFRDELAKQMTPEQLADAQKRTEKFWSDMKK
ncbi:MAG TPA: hypothetical protein VHY30_01605 [Verrucomicrobiae bacterium]|jgi:hypothetical protein|nr:hypothetical protein [Verrucomicrobiae bacterium]